MRCYGVEWDVLGSKENVHKKSDASYALSFLEYTLLSRAVFGIPTPRLLYEFIPLLIVKKDVTYRLK